MTSDFDRGDTATAVLDEPQPTPETPAIAPRPRSTRYQTLDMWRGIACLMLVMYHATFYASHATKTGDPSTWTVGGLAINALSKMWIGVPIFFVVSGYCIAASSDASRRRPHSLRTYFARRIRRIYPPLWVACALCVALVFAATAWESIHAGCMQLPHLEQFTPGNWLGNLTATEAWRTNVSGGESAYLMKNTWTLCYEEQFYAVVGLLLLVAAPRFFTAAALLTIGTLAARHLSRAAGGSLEGFFFDGHWLLFAVGILVYYRLHYAHGRSKWAVTAGLVGVMLYAVVDYKLATTAFDKHVNEYLFIAAAFGLLLIRLYKADGYLAKHAWLQPLNWYGKMSYSVYLTHFPIVVILGFLLAEFGSRDDWFAAAITVPLAILISIPVGRAFHLAVERHFMNAPLDSKRAQVSTGETRSESLSVSGAVPRG